MIGEVNLQNLSQSEILFLEKIWEPVASLGEEILKSKTPIGVLGSNLCVSGFWFTQHGARLFIEINELLPGQLSAQEQRDYLLLHNELMLSGWLVLRLNTVQLENDPSICQRLLRQALDFSQSHHLPPSTLEPLDLRKIRKKQIIEIAKRQNGKIWPREVAAEFNINIRLAADWLMQFAKEGLLSFASGNKLTKVYILNEGGHCSTLASELAQN
jgi:hypothetical protein